MVARPAVTAARRRTLIATTAWEKGDEAQLAVRRLAGALAVDGPVEVVALVTGRTGGWLDGAVAVHGYGPLRVGPCAVPDDRWDRLAALVGERRPDLLVLAGLSGSGPLEAVARAGAAFLAVAPLVGSERPDRRAPDGPRPGADALEEPGRDDAGRDDAGCAPLLTVGDAVVVLSAPEAQVLADAAGGTVIHDVGLWLGSTVPPLDPLGGPDIGPGTGSVVVFATDPFPGADPWAAVGSTAEGPDRAGRLAQAERVALAERLARVLAPLEFTVVSEGQITVRSGGEQCRYQLLGRVQLDALVRAATAVVDLWPGPLVGRVALGAAAAGVPVILPAGSRPAEVLTGRRLPEGADNTAAPGVVEAIRRVLDGLGVGPHLAARADPAMIGDIRSRYGDSAAFVERVRRAVGSTS
jgi:hypothetical protein